MPEKKSGGRPPRYPDETAERISLRIRPRYKRVIDLISNDRQEKPSEVLNLALAKLGMEYQINGKPVLDYICEPIREMKLNLASTVIKKVDDDAIARMKNIYSYYQDMIKEYSSSSELLFAPKDKFFYKTLVAIDKKICFCGFSDFKMCIFENLIYESWNIGFTSDRFIEIWDEVIIEKLGESVFNILLEV